MTQHNIWWLILAAACWLICETELRRHL